MSELNTFFPSAARDLLFLLDRGYPKSPAVDLVGNRYGLGRTERMLLYRGVFDHESASNRKKKLIGLGIVSASPLFIDGFNVTITLDSYLRGLFVFRATDGYVRDVSEFHRGYRVAETTGRSLELIAGVLKDREGKTVILLNSCMDACGELAPMAERVIERLAPSVEVRTEKYPDNGLTARSSGRADTVVATSDTEILDLSDRAIDLPSLVLEEKIGKRVFDLEHMLDDTGG